MSEVWKDVKGYEGLYKVSNSGRVMRADTGRILKPGKSHEYLCLSLFNDGKRKQFSVHRLVAEAFIENPNNYPQVNHIDENKINNSVSNLEWVTAKYNVNYGTRNERCSKAMLGNSNSKTRKVMCVDTNEIFNSISDAAKMIGVDSSTIIACCKGKLKTTGCYCFKYV